MKYARQTTVPISKTRSEIEQLVMKYGADSYGQALEATRAMVQFRLQGLVVRFLLPLSKSGSDATPRPLDDQSQRQRWRALLLVIKAKLEAVETRIETIEHAFLAEIVLPDGKTMAEWATPQIRKMLADGSMPKTLIEDSREELNHA